VEISNVTYVTSGYFETLGLPAVRGRVVADRDTPASPPVIVVNQSFVRLYLRDRDPIGQRVQVANAAREIVGVVRDVQQVGGFNGFGPIDALPLIYVPFSQVPPGGLRTFHTWFAPAWIVRTVTAGAVGELALRQAMAAVDPHLPISTPRSIDAVRSSALARQRLLMVLVGVLAVSALLLGAVASGVAERTREIGIRLALGSTVGDAIRLAALPGIVLTLIGLAVGSGLAYATTGLIRSLLWGVQAHDPLTFAAVAATLLVVSAIASLAPAMRIRRLDPVALLRE
jgi:predicted lysophospholipase L1 biosynthesis ABC-type transport system permease subunit